MKVIIKCFKSIYLAINQLPEPTHISTQQTHSDTSSSHIAATKQHGKHKDTEQWPLRGKRENQLTYVNIHCVAISFRKNILIAQWDFTHVLVNDQRWD